MDKVRARSSNWIALTVLVFLLAGCFGFIVSDLKWVWPKALYGESAEMHGDAMYSAFEATRVVSAPKGEVGLGTVLLLAEKQGQLFIASGKHVGTDDDAIYLKRFERIYRFPVKAVDEARYLESDIEAVFDRAELFWWIGLLATVILVGVGGVVRHRVNRGGSLAASAYRSALSFAEFSGMLFLLLAVPTVLAMAVLFSVAEGPVMTDSLLMTLPWLPYGVLASWLLVGVAANRAIVNNICGHATLSFIREAVGRAASGDLDEEVIATFQIGTPEIKVLQALENGEREIGELALSLGLALGSNEGGGVQGSRAEEKLAPMPTASPQNHRIVKRLVSLVRMGHLRSGEDGRIEITRNGLDVLALPPARYIQRIPVHYQYLLARAEAALERGTIDEAITICCTDIYEGFLGYATSAVASADRLKEELAKYNAGKEERHQITDYVKARGHQRFQFLHGCLKTDTGTRKKLTALCELINKIRNEESHFQAARDVAGSNKSAQHARLLIELLRTYMDIVCGVIGNSQPDAGVES